MRIIDCAQYSCEWWTVRRGVPTASRFSSIITAKEMKYSVGSLTYIAELIADQSNPRYGQQEEYVSRAMLQGKEIEPNARKAYEFDRGESVRQVGFIVSECGRYGCSPDALVGDGGGLELKCPKHETLVGWLLRHQIPDEHLAQMHGCMIVTGRRWWDFMGFSPDLPALIMRVHWNEFTDALAAHLERFSEDYAGAIKKMEALGWTPTEMQWVEPTRAELEDATEDAMI